jgi:hypothetical protein
MSTAPTPAQTGSDLRVDTSVSTPANATVYCNKIVLAFPVDAADPAALYAAAPVSSLNTSNWAVTSAVQTGEELGMGVMDLSYTTFIYTCSASQYFQINYNLVFGAFGQASPATGSTQMLVKETSGTTSDPGTFTDKTGAFEIDKSPPQLFLVNFVATNPNAPTVPISDFANAAPIYFEWESNGTYFQIFASGQSAPIYSGTQTNFTLSAGIARGTTFVLAAMMTGNPSGDSPSSGYLPVYLYGVLTVTVSNPDLTPRSVTAGTLSVTGNTSLTGTLGVTGASTMAAASVGGTLGVAGALTATGGANVSGGLTADNATVNGGLTVGGSASLNGGATMSSANVNGPLSVTGGATVTGFRATGGSVAMFGGGTMLASGTNVANTQVYAQTDGFAVAQIQSPESNSASSYGYAQIYTAGQWFQQEGGNVGQFGSGWDYCMNNSQTTMTLPIPANTYWQYYGAPGGGNQEDPPIQFWWFPIGSVSGEDSYRIVTDGSGPGLAEPPQIVTTDLSGHIRENAETFIERLAEAFNVKLGVKERDELADLLARRG